MVQAERRLPIFLQRVYADFALLRNVRMENLCHEEAFVHNTQR